MPCLTAMMNVIPITGNKLPKHRKKLPVCGVSMYETFFNLRIKPFELVPDPSFIYLSKSHKKAITFLDYGIRARAGFILLTGEVGSGKTTIIRDMLNKRYEQLVLAKVFNTRVTSEQLLAMINDDFGLQTQGKDKVTLIRDLNEFLVVLFTHVTFVFPFFVVTNNNG